METHEIKRPLYSKENGQLTEDEAYILGKSSLSSISDRRLVVRIYKLREFLKTAYFYNGTLN